jgi:spore maturation protein CgeB
MVRLGHDVTLLDPYHALPAGRVVSTALAQWNRYTGGLGLVEIVKRWIMKTIGDSQFDLAWVDHGAIVSASLVRELKDRIPKVICYCIDDPFGGRDAAMWREFLSAVPFYDLVAVMRTANIEETYGYGARRVMRVFMSADEVAHRPRELSASEYERWRSEVLFVGTAFPERGPFLAELVRLGVPLTLYGNRYERLREWPILKPHWRPADASTIDSYANAIAAAKVCLGLLSRGNRDLHTTRSMEIPSLGAVLCAERTTEHTALYDEGVEAVFWSSAQECAEQCFKLLGDDERRRTIARAGRARFLRSRWRNDRVVQDILATATGMSTKGTSAGPMPVDGAGA